MRCDCCEGEVVRGADVPDARWIRFGDRYCFSCRWLMPRELIEAGVDGDGCPEHGRRPMKKMVPRPFDRY